ncbi:benzoate-CoA ligase family protein [Nocardia higoensis]|uniref:Benzoate-CoA ligase family protein n=1 Tax=Nocardia higoensis TaxID=228599 RepID=A0ABS0D7W1_9NOCA|nr:benzoate-CoA ligase family protein [Nocardia higoensis]MBF6354476.1 benzoate-CoA ligase family protein [Nocardia higoensis]
MSAIAADPAPLVNVVDRVVAEGGERRPAIWTEDGPISYGSLLRMIRIVAWRLQTRGIRREHRIVVELDDSPELVAIILGAMRIGAIPVLINPWAQIAGYALEHSRAEIWVADGAPDMGAEWPVVSSAELVAEPADGLGTQITPITIEAEDVAFWLYSSGSTGRPKAVVHLHRDIAGSCNGYAGGVLDVRADDVLFSTAKMFHAYGLGGGLLFPLWHGASVMFLQGRPGPEGIVHTIERFRPTVLFSVPALYHAVLRHAEAVPVDVASLRLCVSAAEPLAAPIWHRWRDRFGLEILDGVGSTEMLHIYCSNRPGEIQPGSAGYAVPGYDIELRPHPGAPENAGELWVRGPSAFDHYWRNQDATRDAFCGNWFRTGDCFTIDNGRYRYMGRLDDLMKIGGQWVSAHLIESELLEHPTVAEAAVIAVATGTMNRIKAFVVPAEPKPGTDAAKLITELRRWCAQRLRPDQVPHYVELVGSLPKTPAGKVQRFVLRERANLSAAR